MPTTVTSKGQVTIPKRIRDHLGLRAGARVEFELEVDGRTTMRPVRAAGRARRGRFAALRGTADAGLSTDEIMGLTRGRR